MATTDQTRNPWLRPTDDPAKVDECYKDGFDDILSERRQFFNDLPWLMKAYSPPRYKYNVLRNPAQLAADVLNSDRVKVAIDEVSKLTGKSRAEVSQESTAILAEMGHKLSLPAVRAVGYALSKLFKKLFSHIYVNVDGVNKLGEVLTEYPVLLMPSHRSYFDFLILSYVMFHYNLPLPAIAAAQDFMSMAGIGRILRGCGAFYIKRTFGSNRLYWAIFTEYVQTHLCNGDHPLEFFVEGTRSRTQKAYSPKLGMLSASLEAYFKGMVPDIMIVPISISYDRVLEESLFAHELLGIPKPKESTSKLFKASKILSENFGSIHIVIDDAISLRRFSAGKIDRVSHSLSPRHVVGLLPEEQKLVKEVGCEIVYCQQKNMVVSVWSMVATVLLQHLDGISLARLTQLVVWLRRQAANLGGYIDWPGQRSAEDVVLATVKAQHQAVAILPDNRVLPKTQGAASSRDGRSMLLAEETFSCAVTELWLAIYRNQLLHIFSKVGLLSLVISYCHGSQLSTDEACGRFCFLVKLFCKEFVLDATHIEEDFKETLRSLVNTGDIILEHGNAINVDKSVTMYTRFLSRMFEPFVLGYWVLCEYLLLTSTYEPATGKPSAVRPKEATAGAQQLAVRLLQHGALKQYETLNLDMLHNALHALRDVGAVDFELRNNDRFVVPRTTAINKVIDVIKTLVDLPNIEVSELTLQAHKVTMLSKL